MKRTPCIVVGMDFSDGAIRALEYALELATALGANVACVHAYEDAPGAPALHDPTPGIRERLERVVAQCTRTWGSISVDAVVRRGAPWEKLVNIATDLGAELIVVGAAGQRGASNDGLIGTVPSRLVATSPRSVLVVR